MRKAKAFTLTELLVVIAIITIVAILAVPSFRALTGGRSTEAAQNIISATLARARTEALGLEEPRGVLFYRDRETQRVGMALVRSVRQGAVHEIDLVPDRDTTLLPQGVGIQFIDDDNPTVTGDEDRYIGFNTRVDNTNATVVPYGGVIMFDRKGFVSPDGYAFRVRYATPAPRPSQLAQVLFDNISYPGAGNDTLPPRPAPNPLKPSEIPSPPPLASSKLGFVLYDDAELKDTHGDGRAGAKGADTDNQVSLVAGNGPWEAEAAEEQWLNENAVPVLVNRYNGTLIRGE